MEEKGEMPSMLMHSLFHLRRQILQAELTRLGLGDLGQPRILFMLRKRGREGRVGAQRELADALHVSPATIAVSLRSLERGGYVEKKRSEESDQRRKAVCLTPKGEEALAKCVQVYHWVERSMYRDFSPEELEQVRAYHLRMLLNLREEYPQERRNCPC